MAWCGRSLCVGLKKEYVMIDAFDKRTTELCPINKVRRGVGLQALSRLHSLARSLAHSQGVNPMVISLPDDRILVGRDTVSFFFGADGKAAKRYGLAWSVSPITVSMHRRCSLVFGQQTRSLTHSLTHVRVQPCTTRTLLASCRAESRCEPSSRLTRCSRSRPSEELASSAYVAMLAAASRDRATYHAALGAHSGE